MIHTRPQFRNVEEYVDHVGAAIAAGVKPWEPATKQELQAVLEHFPETARAWIPSPEIVWQTPCLQFLIDQWKRRLVDAVRDDFEFRSRLAQQLLREVNR